MLTDKIWEWLNLSHLRFIDLRPDNRPYFESDKKMGDFFRKAPLLEELIFSFTYWKNGGNSGDLSGCLQLKKKIEINLFYYVDEFFFEMANQARNFESLFLRCCDNIAEETILEAIFKCPKLDNISIQKCPLVIEDDWKNIEAEMLKSRGIKTEAVLKRKTTSLKN